MTGVAIATIVARLAEREIAYEVSGDVATVVDDVFADDRDVQPGGLFCCVVGARTDGHDKAAAAVAAGAVALVCQQPLGLGVPEIVVSDTRLALGPVAAVVHGDPSRSLCCVGVTGTNGKTTTAALIGTILRAAGRSVAVIGTLTGTRTTPEAPDLQRNLAQLLARGVDAVVMEVSSHALAQHRVDEMHFDAAVFTNLSRDHLDFHGTMEEYFRAKARLFEPDLSLRGVVNVDDAHGRLLRDASSIPVEGFGLADAEPIRGLAPVDLTWRGESVVMPLAGRFNVYNSLAAAFAASCLGIDDATIRRGLREVEPVPGRFEMVGTGGARRVIVDYAHTPDGLANALHAATELADGNRVLLVFGAGGDRDRTKRPLMGAVAQDADIVIVTDDNPRSESPRRITDEILTGMTREDRVIVEHDRRRAIARALDASRSGDVVLIAGKGHETTQTIGERVLPFDDRVVARELLTERGFAA